MSRFYVYLLRYPPELGGAVFYIGKGTGARMHQHEVNAANGEEGKRADTIRAIWEAGFQIVKAKIFETDDEQAAYAEERRLIDVYDSDGLVNISLRDLPPSPYRETVEYPQVSRYALETHAMLRILTEEHGISLRRIVETINSRYGYKTRVTYLENYLLGRSQAHSWVHKHVARAYIQLIGEPYQPPS